MRLTRGKSLSAVVLCAATVLAVSGGLAAPASAAAAAPRGDFNGDGFADLAVGVPDATVGGRTEAGYVNVVWGGTGGLGKHGSTTLSQNSAGIPGTSEAEDAFGRSVQAADLNGDGYSDLAVSAPAETLDVPGQAREGAVYVLWGSASGLKSGSTVAKGDHADENLGAALTSGDYDHDGHQDLALTAHSDESSAVMEAPGPLTTGAVPPLSKITSWHFAGPNALASGDLNGDGTDDLALTYSGMETQGTEVHSKASGTWATTWSAPDTGSALAIGDFDADGAKDLAIGLVRPNPEADTTYCADLTGGAIALVLGAKGTTLGGATGCTTQSTPGVGGTAEPEDDFGASLATVSDSVHDGYDALLAGTPHEAVGTAKAGGSFTYLEATGTHFVGGAITQNSSQVAGTAEAGDLFGAAVAAGDYDGDQYTDAATGAPGENSHSGGIWYRETDEEPPFPDTVAVTPSKLGLAGAVSYGAVLGRRN
ncbi:VCBS repeat-containing protein [Streptomyces sp. NPDC057636]|uniref:VCBS repeat-containing protein n=1 Tax=Streptomyces sp. NPDC057636 TaxID=3346189 RepID=UPI0036CEA467